MSSSTGQQSDQRPTFSKEMQSIAKVGAWVAFLISIIGTGIPAIIAYITDKIAPALTIWNVLAATAPLAASIAIIGTGLFRNWFDSYYGFLFGSALTLSITFLIARFFGMPVGSDPGLFDWLFKGDWVEKLVQLLLHLHPKGLAETILRFLGDYWSLFGGRTFFSSVLVGGFLAWCWGRQIAALPGQRKMTRTNSSMASAAADCGTF